MVDIVITWVDGDDPAHIEKRKKYLSAKHEERRKDMAGKERYDFSGEIFYCIGSILRFAPFVRKIFIVTDGQRPPVEGFLERNFPENKIPVEIVDHKAIFCGYDEYLPTFCSRSIETMLFRIPGLSERFVYFNDDFFLTAPIKETDWFSDGKVVCYARKMYSVTAKVLRILKRIKTGGQKTIGYKDGMLNAAEILESRHFWLFRHSPSAMYRSVLEEFYRGHENILRKNISHRFRDAEQYNPQALFFLLAERSNRLEVRSYKERTLFLKPEAGYSGYVRKRTEKANHNDKLLFGCINSLGSASEIDRNDFLEWISCRLRL